MTPCKKTLGRRALLLHLSDFSCQYQRRVVDTKTYHHKCFSSYSHYTKKLLFSQVYSKITECHVRSSYILTKCHIQHT